MKVGLDVGRRQRIEPTGLAQGADNHPPRMAGRGMAPGSAGGLKRPSGAEARG